MLNISVCLLVICGVGNAGTILDITFDEAPLGATSDAQFIADDSGNNYDGWVGGGIPLPVIVETNAPSGTRCASFSGAGDIYLRDATPYANLNAIYKTRSGSTPTPYPFEFDTNSSFTVEAMIKVPVGAAGTYGIICNDNVGNEWWLAVVNGAMRWGIDSSTSVGAYYTRGSGLADGEWHHIALVFERDAVVNTTVTFKYYIDYIQIDTASLTSIGTVGDGTVDSRIGAMNSGYDFPGVIDRVRISDIALPVLDFFYDGQLGEADVVAHYEFRGSGTAEVGASIRDQTENHPASVLGAALAYVPGSPAYGDTAGLRFDEDNLDRVDIPAHADFAFDGDVGFTAEILFRTDRSTYSAGTDDPVLMGNLHNGAADIEWYIRLEDITGIHFRIDGTDNAYSLTETGVDVGDNEWHHIAAVYDGVNSKIMLYLDYEFLKSGNVDMGDFVGNSDQVIRIGEWLDATRSFKGDIDFVRISNGALVPPQFRTTAPPLLGTLVFIQ